MRNSLVQEIGNILGTAPPYMAGSAASACDDFEVYIFALAIDAARREGAQIRYLNRNGLPTQTLIFRTSPGAIYSSTNGYAHTQIQFPGCPALEAHVGILVAGKSSVVHECDVVVLHKAEADTCRREQVHPRHSKVILAVECKFYSTNLGIDLARSFLGLTEEIQHSDRYFVANTSSKSVEKMLSQHDRVWETQVIPGNDKNQLRLRALFENTFKHFKALSG